ncbi:1-acyl-sn-glycerol-3-phosphate acyltransferase [Pseudoruegeria aquimaris]|uniref:1-acyl-sn-glycerol-3-phosphate acyltransferase n=1 Tax=Pseudoruegeria aquimaris TaxID=393663 RepID=A0A1Y5TKJ8_9RHOB|nr:1-acyl-sn-glycerol-3-phosphate acyltransferase [Pseudoruegeria aquimaris]SLN64170.1 1-acyl-sn-glycerol-3-phosphate acyltransferase [Pseudoruegeria aquimaris]
MAYAWRWLRSLFFSFQIYLMMFLMALFFTPLAIWKRDWAFRAIHTWCRYVRWTAAWMLGLKSEVRGEIPTDEVLIAAKHQSFFDIILIVSVTPRPKFIMKKQLKWAPILGYYAMRIGCVPVDRGKRGKAIAKMVEDVNSGRQEPGQLIIYPQGTRVAPGVKLPYKVGPAILYEQTGSDCVPAATNVGVFWPRHGVYRKPGLAVVEFLPRIPAGLDRDTFMKQLEEVVETRSDALMAEAGFPVTP